MTENKHIVVGGGIAGICAALFLSRKGKSVVLIEQDKSLGGLLKSVYPFDQNFHFDYGTHFLAQTGNFKLDKILFNSLEVNYFDYLKVGSFYKSLYQKNGFVTDFHLKNRNHFFKQINLNPLASAKSLKDQLINSYGEGYTNELFNPILKKFYGLESEMLRIDAHRLFGLQRIIAADEMITNDLKANHKVYDNLLAYHSYNQGLSPIKSSYPVKGGVGKWIETLTKLLHQNGVKIFTETKINSIEKEGNKINKIKFGDNYYGIDQLYWTAPLVFILPYLNLEPSYELTSLPRLTSYIAHFVVDKKYKTDLYYFQCFDPDFRTFRVTLYDNFSESCGENSFRITVESLLKENDKIEETFNQTLFNELIQMKVISSDSNILKQTSSLVRNSFPVLTKEIISQEEKPDVRLKKTFKNLHFFGKAYSEKWFMNEVIDEIYQALK